MIVFEDFNAFMEKLERHYMNNDCKRTALFIKAEDKVCESNNPVYIHQFAKRLKGADVKKLEDAIIRTNIARYMFLFALYVKGANIKRLEKEVKETGDEAFTRMFFTYVIDNQGQRELENKKENEALDKSIQDTLYGL